MTTRNENEKVKLDLFNKILQLPLHGKVEIESMIKASSVSVHEVQFTNLSAKVAYLEAT